jgi:acetyl esterase/lipase
MAFIPSERSLQVLADLRARFDRIDIPYKTVYNTPITAAIFVPKTIPVAWPTTAPVLAHFHGGALLMGTNPRTLFPYRLVTTPETRLDSEEIEILGVGRSSAPQQA